MLNTIFQGAQEIFLAYIQAEVDMNEVPEELIFNWDQTALKFMATGQWTMSRAGEQIIMITNSDVKRQVMAVFAATLTGELLPPPPPPPQIIYKGKTVFVCS